MFNANDFGMCINAGNIGASHCTMGTYVCRRTMKLFVVRIFFSMMGGAFCQLEFRIYIFNFGSFERG
jgi:hypothetical protein